MKPDPSPEPAPGGLVPAPPRDGAQFPALDTLRAVGALCVVLTHVSFLTGDYTTNGVWGAVLARLDVGVALFFVLSGFLLARPWLAAAPGRRPSTVPYLWKRVLRIAPLYLLTATLALSLIPSNHSEGVSGWIQTLLLLNTVTDPSLPIGLTHMWSLAVEVSFYLVLPAVMALLLGRQRADLPVRRLLGGLTAMLALSIWWQLDGVVRARALEVGSPGQWLPGYLGWFAAGILLALVQVLHSLGRTTRLTRPLVALAQQPGACWLMALALLLVAATPIAGPVTLDPATVGQSLVKNMIYAVIGFLIVLTGVFSPQGTYARVLSHRWGRRLGFISFGVFCLHMPLLSFWMWAMGWEVFQAPFLVLLPLILASSLLAAELSYRLVERPALLLRHRGPGRADRRRKDRDGKMRSEPTTSSAASGTTTR